MYFFSHGKGNPVRKYLVYGAMLFIGVLCLVGTADAEEQCRIKRLGHELSRGNKEALAEVAECSMDVQKNLVPQLVDAYLEGDWDLSRSSRKLLVTLGRNYPKAVAPKLGQRFQQAAPDELAVLLPAVELLRDLGPSARPAASALAEALGSPDFHVRRQAVWALAAIGPAAKPAVPALLEQLDTEDTLVQREALRILQTIHAESDALIEHLEGQPEAGIDAIERAGLDARKALTPVLVDAYLQGGWTLALTARRSLMALADSAPQRVVDELASNFQEATELSVRLPAISLIRDLGPAASFAVPTLVEALNSHDFHLRQQATWAIAATGSDGSPALGALANLLWTEDALLRKNAVAALKAVGPDASIIEDLAAAVCSQDPLVQRFAISALEKLGADGQEAIPELVNVVKGDDLFLSLQAARALGSMGRVAKSAMPALMDLAEGRNQQVNEVVEAALEKVSASPKSPKISQAPSLSVYRPSEADHRVSTMFPSEMPLESSAGHISDASAGTAGEEWIMNRVGAALEKCAGMTGAQAMQWAASGSRFAAHAMAPSLAGVARCWTSIELPNFGNLPKLWQKSEVRPNHALDSAQYPLY